MVNPSNPLQIHYTCESAVLLDMNDAGYETVFNAGEAVYIDYKKGRVKQKFMVAPKGTTMRAISQQYAVPMEKLYKYNDFKIGQQPYKGEQIRLKPKSIAERLYRER